MNTVNTSRLIIYRIKTGVAHIGRADEFSHIPMLGRLADERDELIGGWARFDGAGKFLSTDASSGSLPCTQEMLEAYQAAIAALIGQ